MELHIVDRYALDAGSELMDRAHDDGVKLAAQYLGGLGVRRLGPVGDVWQGVVTKVADVHKR